MSIPVDLIKGLMHGFSRFREGEFVSVSRAITGIHLVDRGMLSTSVDIPLVPGDRLEYRGRHLKTQAVVRVPSSDNEAFLARIVKSNERDYVDRSAFLLYVAYDSVCEGNDR